MSLRRRILPPRPSYLRRLGPCIAPTIYPASSHRLSLDLHRPVTAISIPINVAVGGAVPYGYYSLYKTSYFAYFASSIRHKSGPASIYMWKSLWTSLVRLLLCECRYIYQWHITSSKTEAIHKSTALAATPSRQC